MSVRVKISSSYIKIYYLNFIDKIFNLTKIELKVNKNNVEKLVCHVTSD